MSARSRYLSAVLMEAVRSVEQVRSVSCGLGIDGYEYAADRGRFDFTVPVPMVERIAERADSSLAGRVAQEWDDQMRHDVQYDRDLEIPRAA